MTTVFNNGSALQQLCMTKVTDSQVRALVSATPETSINFLARITGSIKVLADTAKAPSVAIPYLIVLGLFIVRMGIQRNKAFAIFMECLREALTMGTDTREQFLKHMPELELAETAVRNAMKDLPKITEKGKVYANLSINFLPPEEDNIREIILNGV